MDDEKYFAGHALQALILLNSGESPEKIAKQAFNYAAAMKKELDARKGNQPPAAADDAASPFAKVTEKAKPRSLTETEMAKDAALEEYRKNKPRW